MAGSVSIREHLAPPPEPKAAPLADQPGEQPASAAAGPATALNQALLLKAWADHAQLLKQQGKSSMHATLTANKPEITGAHEVSFTIVNTVQENYMRDEKAALLGHLRSQLGDPALNLIIVKQESATPKRRYTPKDRFQIMAEKNPALFKLREDLDLDLGQ